MKFLVIHTGGTISSVKEDNVISATKYSEVVSEFIKINGSNFDFSEKQFSAILSENADDKYFEQLINYLNNLDTTGFDGLIILYGTDTFRTLRHLSVWH